MVKIVLEYSRDKVKDLAAKFNHGDLNKVETRVKHSVEGNC